MRKAHATRLAALSIAFGLAAALMAAAPTALAQQTAAPKAPEPASTPMPVPPQGQEEMAGVEEEFVLYGSPQVGDATQDLLAWQRGGEIASATPRPIAGDVANRSYQRYLKSFEFPIPESMGSIVKQTAVGGGTAPK